MKKLSGHVSFYISIKRETHEFIEKLSEKNGRTLASQIRIMLDKLAAKK